MMYHNIDQIKAIGVYDKIIQNARYIGEEKVNDEEAKTTNAVSKYECPLVIDGKHYIADMTTKEYGIGQYIVNEIHLYDTKLKDDNSAPSASSIDGVPSFNSQSSSFSNKDTTSLPNDQTKGVKYSVQDPETEMIFSAAKANGTWLKAPNGQPTNLSPKQWVDVRTKRFKEWFGDWELAELAEYLMNDDVVAILNGNEFTKDGTPLTEKVTKFYNENYNGKVTRKGLGEVILDKRSVKDSTIHGFGKAKTAAFAAVPNIITEGRVIDEQRNWKGRNYDSVTIAAPIRIGGSNYVGIVIVLKGQGTNSNRFYLHEVVLQENLQDESFKTDNKADSHRGDIAKVMQKIFNSKTNSSKIVDANGEPKVVYHQTNATEYVNVETGERWDDLDWMERAEWDERDDWDEYWQERDFYTFSRANARTTQEFDGFFFAPEYDEYHEYGDRTISAFLNIKNPASRDDYNIDSSKNNAGQEERLRLQQEGYDGVIREVDGVVWEYVAFEPNQIKSADPVTYDDNGNVIPLSERFNPENEDIRYSLGQPTDEDVTFDNFFERTSAIFTQITDTPTTKPDYISRSGSTYWYGEDERGKYVIRRSDHWSAIVRDEEDAATFNAKPDDFNNIASCYWALDMRTYKPQSFAPINKETVRSIDYNSGSKDLNIVFNDGKTTRRRGVEPRDMRKYFELRNSGDMSAANGYVVDMVNELYSAAPMPTVQTAKAYLDEFTKWSGESEQRSRLYSVQEVNDRFNEELAALTEENARERILNIGIPSPVLLACGIENKPIRLYGAKLLSKVRKHGYTIGDLKNLPLAISEPIAVFKGSMSNSFAILTELLIGDNNVLATLSVGRGGHDVDFNIISSVYDKRGDSVVRWVNDGKLLYVDKEKALDYFSVSAPLAEAQNNQELISTTKVIQNFENPKIEPRFSLIGESEQKSRLYSVSEVTMPDLEENNTMHSVDVTPAMRESVMQGQPKFSLSEETTKIFDTAKAKFGTTYDMREAGYILPDGSMLDFSGRHEVKGADNSFLNGRRSVDHRAILEIADDYEGNETGVKTDMGDFLDRGAIRIDYNVGTINLNVAPTRHQKERLRRLIERNNGDITIDFGKGWDTEHYAEYEGARASRVLGDIDRYFDEGIKPTGNVRFSLSEINARFNEELDAFKARQNISELHLGVPSPLLRACGVSASEIFITAKTLRDHLKKHNLTEDEIKNLPIAINDPIMVYEWGEKAKSKIIITQIPRGEQRITVAIKMERGGRRMSVNELASVHGKDVERLMNEMLTTKSDFGQDNLKYVNKEIAMQWLGIAPPEGAASLTDAQQSIANIIQNFENPKIEPKNSLRELDVPYLEAVERGDMATAQRMVLEAAERTGYLSDTSYQGSLAFNGAAPMANAYFDTKEQRKDAWDNEEYDGTMSLGDYADNNIDTNDLEWQLSDRGNYRRAEDYTKESIDNINNAINGGNHKITIYRAVPNSVEEGTVRNGDWVTPSRKYAEYHIELQDWVGGRIIEQEVDIDNIWWNGDDINEWGYDDGSNYGYRNTPNNRKLLDPVTYDDNGNVIPLSERFNPAKEDVRYSISESPAPFSTTEAGEIAEQMRADGALPSEIYARTGWWWDAKGRMRNYPRDKQPRAAKIVELQKTEGTYDERTSFGNIEAENVGKQGLGSTTEEQVRLWLKNRHLVAIDNIRKKYKMYRDTARRDLQEKQRRLQLYLLVVVAELL